MGDLADFITRFKDWQDSNDNGSSESPCNSNKDPESKVRLGELSGRDGKKRPDNNQDQSQDVSTAGDPSLGFLKHLGVLVLGLQSTGIVFDKGDLLIKGGEVKVLWINKLGVDNVDESRRKNGNQVTAKHGFVGSKSINGDFSFADLGSDQPGDNGKNQSRPGSNDSSSSRGLGPLHQHPQGSDGRSNNDTHEQVHPSKRESDFEQENGESSHDQSETDNDISGNLQDLFASGLGVEVFAVDIVGNQRRDGDRFSRSSGHNGHEKHNQNEDRASISQQVGSNGRGDKTISGFGSSNGKHQSGGSKTKGSGKSERNGEPADSSKDVSTGGRGWASSDSGLPVRLIDKDGSKVTDNVDNTKHKTSRRDHGQVRTISVSFNGTASKLASFVSSVDRSTLFRGVTDSLVQKVVNGIRGVSLDVDNKDHCNQDTKDDDSVDVRGQESSLKTTRGSVQDHTPGDQERCPTVVNTSQSFDSGSTTEQKHRCHNQVGAKAEKQKGLVGSLSPTGIDNLTDSVGRRSDSLEGNGKDTKQNDLNGGTRGVPERSRDTVLPGDVGRLQKSSSPSPLRDNDRGSKTSLDRTSSSVKVLGSDLSMASILLANHDNDGSNDTEKCTKTNDDGPSNSLRKWGIAAKERVRTLVLGEWGSGIAKGNSRHD
mmetsp:Transcript_30218/g.72522  ORF Transcript_30218/g.72522 Transcript_30218/m.72522 type:complete len:654 (+) Transcript_30218:319-2280(+)